MTKDPVEIGQYLIVHPGICHGQLTFKGTRIPVETVLHCLARGETFDYIFTSWPRVSREAIEEAVDFATESLLMTARPARPNPARR